MSPAILRLSKVAKSYGSGATSVKALHDVTMEIGAGEFVAVMGPSGSGKSSLLSLAGGLDTASKGKIFVEGTSLNGLHINELARLRRRAVGYVFQDFNLIPTLTAVENVALPRELDGISPRTARKLAMDALGRIGIASLAKRFMDELSGGQQQRVAIARAIVGQRRLILADEPTGALDSATGDEILGVLRQCADEGSAVMLVTHEARHASWADRVIFLRDGLIVDEASQAHDPAVLFSQAQH